METVEVLKLFGPYQCFMLAVISLGYICNTANVCFMVFGGVMEPNSTKSDTKNSNNSDEIIRNSLDITYKSAAIQFSVDANLSGIMTFMQLFGALLGALIGSRMSELRGRKITAWMSLTTQVVLGVLSIFTPNWKAMMMFRFLIGIATGGFETAANLLVVEWSGTQYKKPFETSILTVQFLGFCWVSLISWLCGDWRKVCLIMNLCGAPCILAFRFLLESPHWVLKFEPNKLPEFIVDLSKWNKTAEDIDRQIISELRAEHFTNRRLSVADGYIALLCTKASAHYTGILAYSSLVSGILCHFILFNVANIHGSMFLNLAILGIVNTISGLGVKLGTILQVLNNSHLHQLTLFCLCLVLSTGLILIEVKVPRALLDVGLLSCTIAGSFFSVPLWLYGQSYAINVFHPQLQNRAKCFSCIIFRIGGTLAPLLILLNLIWPALPYIILLSLCVLNLLLIFAYLSEATVDEVLQVTSGQEDITEEGF